MSSFRLTCLALSGLAVLGLALGGCERKVTKEEEIAAGLAPLAKVPAEEQARAKQQVDRIWAEVKPRVLEAYNPPPAQLEFYLDLAALTKFPHRLAGYGSQPDLKDKDVPGSAFAARYVAARLKAMGVELVADQEFPVVQPIQTECVLEVDGEQHPIYEMRPCALLPSITPAEGLAGKTLYAGKGDLAAYGSELPRDRIVVLDLDCEKNWLTPFALGARAVLFIGQDETVDKPFLHVNVPANLPRFYVPKDLAEKLELKTRPREVKILASCQWAALTGRNVIAVVRGTNPHFPGNEERRQAIVLAAPLDSLSEVPRLSAGARDAANCAALLQLARTFQEAPPLRRDVILCFLDGQTQAHAGARAFYGALFRDECDGRSLEKRIKDFDDERQFRDRIIAVCEALAKRVEVLAASQFSEKPGQEELKLITAEMKEKFTASQLRDAAGVLEEEARGLGTQLLDRLRPLRINRRDLDAKRGDLEERIAKAKKDRQPAEEVESLAKETGAISARMSRQDQEIEALNNEFLGWNWVQRDVHKERLSENPKERADVIRRLGKLLKMTEALQSRRKNQLSDARRQAEQAGALRKT
ncbi:MAG TPA: M28 family peptidase, partial [Phycisphaerae bacterium]|nr:M28 family peptidase [Phycisphaerae bacterium]